MRTSRTVMSAVQAVPAATRWAAVAVLALALVGCSGDPAPVAAEAEYPPAGSTATPAVGGDAKAGAVTVASSDSRCVSDTSRLSSGSAKLSVVNNGTKFVTLALRPAAADSPSSDIYRLKDVGPGASGSMIVDLRSGSYLLVCTIGDRSIGTQQRLSVG